MVSLDRLPRTIALEVKDAYTEFRIAKLDELVYRLQDVLRDSETNVDDPEIGPFYRWAAALVAEYTEGTGDNMTAIVNRVHDLVKTLDESFCRDCPSMVDGHCIIDRDPSICG